MERKNQLILFAALVFLVLINFIKNTATVNNTFITIVFLIGMIFICSTFVVIKMKQRADKKHAELVEKTKEAGEEEKDTKAIAEAAEADLSEEE